jgi:hypothetical protein
VGIGGYVVVSCPHCSSETGVHVADGNAPCFSCAEPVTLDRRTRGAMIACYGCLRAGKAALTKNTVFGMIRWEEALQGRTYGVPGPEDADNWVKKELPREAMLELLRTPSYSTWQAIRGSSMATSR